MLISENPNNKNEDELGESGCVYQLFKMLNNEYEFCFKENRDMTVLIAKVYFMILNNKEILLFLYLNNILN